MILAHHFPNLASYRERLDTKLKRKKEKRFLCLLRQITKRLLETNGNASGEGYRPIKKCLCMYLVNDLGHIFRISTAAYIQGQRTEILTSENAEILQCTHIRALSLTHCMPVYKLNKGNLNVWLPVK